MCRLTKYEQVLLEQVYELRGWARSRIWWCDEQITEASTRADHDESSRRQIAEWTQERDTLQAVLRILREGVRSEGKETPA